MKLVEFDSDRALELVQMWRESFEHGVGVIDPNPLADQVKYLLETVVPNNTIRVVMSEDSIVAFVAATRSSISQLYVRKVMHRSGIGTALLAWAKAQSDGDLWLFTFVRNAIARAFYEKHGFRAVCFGYEPFWQLDDVRYEWRRENEFMSASPPQAADT